MKLPSVLTGAVLAVSTLCAAAPVATAAVNSPVEYETRYYSGGQLVGIAQHFCDGTDYAWGDLTQLDNEFIWYGCD